MMLKTGVFVVLLAGSVVFAGCAEVDRGAQDSTNETIDPPAEAQRSVPPPDTPNVAETSNTKPATPEADPPRKSVMNSLFRAVGKGAYDAITGDDETAGESVPSESNNE